MLREPMGKYSVGTCYFDTDYIGVGNKKRRLPIMVFYPSDTKGERCIYKTKDYFKAKIEVKDAEYDTDVITHCYDHVPLSAKRKQYPVMIYSHGLNGYLMDSTVLCTDLASYGYIVFSVGHPYGSEFTYYQDGTYFSEWQEVIGDNPKVSMRENIKLPLRLLPIRSIEKRYADWMKYSEKYMQIQQKLIPLWKEDFKGGLDYIQKLSQGEIESIFNGRLALKRGIGAIGMSLGGLCAVSVAVEDHRISYGINIDGGIYTRLNHVRKDVPLFVLHEQINICSYMPLKALHHKNTKTKVIHGLTHWEFADGIYLSDKGKRDAKWTAQKSKEKTMACLSFIKEIERGRQ